MLFILLFVVGGSFVLYSGMRLCGLVLGLRKYSFFSDYLRTYSEALVERDQIPLTALYSFFETFIILLLQALV